MIDVKMSLKSCSSLEETRRYQEDCSDTTAYVRRGAIDDQYWRQNVWWWLMNSLSDEEKEKKLCVRRALCRGAGNGGAPQKNDSPPAGLARPITGEHLVFLTC